MDVAQEVAPMQFHKNNVWLGEEFENSIRDFQPGKVVIQVKKKKKS